MIYSWTTGWKQQQQQKTQNRQSSSLYYIRNHANPDQILYHYIWEIHKNILKIQFCLRFTIVFINKCNNCSYLTSINTSKHIYNNNYFLLKNNYIERSLSGEYNLIEEEKCMCLRKCIRVWAHSFMLLFMYVHVSA